MNKVRKGNKESKKLPKLNTKERKSAKLALRRTGEATPFLPVAGRT